MEYAPTRPTGRSLIAASSENILIVRLAPQPQLTGRGMLFALHPRTKKTMPRPLKEKFTMHPLIASARFAAFVWYTQQATADSVDASQYAREHWPEFLPAAHEGLGSLLMKIAAPAKSKDPNGSSKRRGSRRQFAQAG